MNENLPPSVWRFISAFMFLMTFTIETTRIRNPGGALNTVVVDTFRPFIRSHETHQFAGIAYYMFGVFITTFTFSRTATTVGIMCLACLDPIAALTGSLFEPLLPTARMRNGKSIIGFLFSAVTAILVVTIVFSQAEGAGESAELFMVAVFVGWAGALTESFITTPQLLIGPPTFPVGIDDNAFIPFISAAVCEVILHLIKREPVLAPLILWRGKMS